MGALTLFDFLFNFRKWQYERNLKHRINNYISDDIGLGHLWNIGDYPKIRKEYDKIRAGLLPADTIAKRILRLYDDKRTGTKFSNDFHNFEPQQFAVDRKYLVVKEGQIHFSKMHLGLASGPPDYIRLGTATPTPTFADFQLQAQVLNANLKVDGGYRDLVGEDEYYGMLFLPSVGTNSYGEAGLFKGVDAAAGDIMITHNKFIPVLVHTINDNAPGVEIIIKHRSYAV